MSRLTGLALLLAGIGIAAYAIPSEDSNGLDEMSEGPVAPTRPTANNARAALGRSSGKTNITATARPRIFSAHKPLLLAKTTRENNTGQNSQPLEPKAPWWRFSLPRSQTPAKKVAVATLSANKAGFKSSPTAEQERHLPPGAKIQPPFTPAEPEAPTREIAPADTGQKQMPMSDRTARNTAGYDPASISASASASTSSAMTDIGAGMTPAIVPASRVRSAQDAFLSLASTKPNSDDARRKLIVTLQRELRRVGCYGGAIDGRWSTASQQAMSRFNRALQATLPVSQPDYILLTLVQGHTTKACGRPCTADEPLSNEGRCTSKTSIVAESTHPRRNRSRAAYHASQPADIPLPVRKTRRSTTTIAIIEPTLPTRSRRSRIIETQVKTADLIRTPSPLGTIGKNRKARQNVKSAHNTYKIPLPGRMTIGAPRHTVIPRPPLTRSNIAIDSVPTSRERLIIRRDAQFASYALTRSKASAAALAEAKRLRLQARLAVQAARAQAQSQNAARKRQQNRIASARQRFRPKYFVGARKGRIKHQTISAKRLRAWKRKKWKWSFFERMQNNSK